MIQGQTQKIDKRAILAVIRAVARKDSFVFRSAHVEEELARMVEDEDEFARLRDELLYHLEGLKYVYRVYEDDRDSSLDRIVVSPVELDDKQLYALTEIANLSPYHDDIINKVINGLIWRWSVTCLEDSTPALAVYRIAKAHGLDVQVVEEHPASLGSGGSVTYSIEGVVKVMKWYWYCNDCIIPAGNNFIEKCSSWKFVGVEGDDE